MREDIVIKAKSIIQREGLDKRNRKREKVYYRAAISYLLRKNGYTTTFIGRLFNVDHSSVVHYDSKIRRLKRDKHFQSIMPEIVTGKQPSNKCSSITILS